MALGGMPLTRVGASGGPGQAVTQAHHSSCTLVLAHYTIVHFTGIIYIYIYINAKVEHIHVLCNTVRRKMFTTETFRESLAKWGGRKCCELLLPA